MTVFRIILFESPAELVLTTTLCGFGGCFLSIEAKMGPPAAAGWANLILLGEVNAELKMGEPVNPELTATKEGGGGNNVDVTGKLEAGTGAVGIKDIGIIPDEEVATLAGGCCGDGAGKP